MKRKIVITLTCQHFGYSQSRSKPSNPHFSMNSITLVTNLDIACGLLTSLEYLSPSESFHPPIAMRTLIPLDLYSITFL